MEPVELVEPIFERMKAAGVGVKLVEMFKAVAEESEGAEDLVVLWDEAEDDYEREMCVQDLWECLNDRSWV